MKNYLIQLYNHAHWANKRLLEALRAIDVKPEKPYNLFTHVLAAEQVWLARLRGNDSSTMVIWPYVDLSQCEQLMNDNHIGYNQFIDELTVEELNQSVTYQNSKGIEFHTLRLDILTHVAMHGSYHRGQIASYLRLDGFEPVNTDYIAFVREQ